MVKAIVGACWGDEGKGKITDMLAETSDIVVRFQGGSNAGHTIINEYGKFALHQLPSGIFRKNIINVIGNGVALSVENFINEIKAVTDRGVPMPNLVVSNRCQIVMPYHKALDGMEEARLAAKSFGSTKSGIAPFYSDKYAKIGFQVSELFDDKDALMEKIDHVLDLKNVLYKDLYQVEPLDREEIYEKLMEYKAALEPFVADTFTLLHDAVKAGKTILLEGQLGSLKDPDLGIYPMVTSSSPLAGFGAIGAGGIPPYAIREIVTVRQGVLERGRRGRIRLRDLRRRGGRAAPSTAATAANTAPRPAAREEWAGWTSLRRATAARRRARPTWPSRCSTRSAISMRSRSAWRTSSTASASIISRRRRSSSAASRCLKSSRAGSATSAASASMRICRKTRESTSSSPKSTSAYRSPWYPTARRARTLFTDNG